MSINVIAVVVTYNRIEMLKECIYSIKNQATNASIKLVIVDNNSEDGTGNYIKKLNDPRIIYYNTGKNIGGAGGFEVGIKKAMEIGCDYVWIMDDDCIPEENALENFLRFSLQNNDFGFLSSYVQWIDGQTCTMNVQRTSISQKLKSFQKDIIPIQYATFVSIFIPKKVIEHVGLPIGDFFIWFDDWEYTRRISKKYRCYFLKSSKVIHKTKHNSGYDLSNDSLDRIERYKIAFRNENYVIRQEGFRGYVYWFLKTIKNFIKVVFFSPNKRIKRLKVMFSGIKDGFKFSPEIHKI